MPEGWQSSTLGDCVTLLSGGTPSRSKSEYWGGEIPWVTCKDMKTSRVYDSEDRLTPIGAANGTRLVGAGTILIVVRGMILANEFPVAVAMRDLAFNQDLKALQCRPNVDSSFLFYWLLANSYRVLGIADEAAHGTKRLQTDRLLSLPIELPPLGTQGAIAAILSAYDDMIDNNVRRIAILEEMAQLIYREWFVHFGLPGHEDVAMADSPLGPSPEGWELLTLSDLVECRRDGTTPGAHLSDRWYVPIDRIPRHSLALLEASPWQVAKSSLQLFEDGDILFGAMRPYFHKVVIAPFRGVTRTTCFVLRARRPELAAYATMLMFQDETVAFASAHSHGTTIPYAVWEGSLARMPVLLPPTHLLDRFHEHAFPMLQILATQFARMRNLRSTRDLLLPKLISGELDVADLDIDNGGPDA